MNAFRVVVNRLGALSEALIELPEHLISHNEPNDNRCEYDRERHSSSRDQRQTCAEAQVSRRA